MNATPTVLIVGGDAGLRRDLAELLSGEGYAPVTAATGKTALKRVKKASPAVALIDLKLADMPGLEVLREIRQRHPRTECIALAGRGSGEAASEAVRLGAYGYVRQPYEAGQLLLAIRRALDTRAGEELQRRLEHLQAIYQMSDAVSRAGVVEEIYEEALECLQRTVKCERASILLLDCGGTMRFKAWRGLSEGYRKAVEGHSPWPPDAKDPQPVLIPDVAEEPALEPLRDVILKEGIQALGFIPLAHGGKLLGKFTVYYDAPHRFTDEDVQLAQTIASHIAFAVQRKQAEEEVERRSRELALLNRVIAAATSTLSVDKVLQTACRELALAFDAPQSAAALLNEERTASTVVAEYLSEGRPSAIGDVIPLAGNPATQYVIDNKAPLAVADAQRDPRMGPTLKLTKRRGTASLLILPLVVRDEVVGTLGVDTTQPRHFTDQEVELAASVAAAVSQALDNARLFEDVRQRAAELEALRQTSLSLTASLELREVLDAILKGVFKLLHGAVDAHIFLYQGGRLTFGSALDGEGRQDQPFSEPRPHGLTYTVARQGETIVVPDMRAHPLFADAPPDWQGAIVGLPLKIGQQVVGVMSVAHSQPRTFSEAELHALALLSDQAAIAIENARLYQELEAHNEFLEQTVEERTAELRQEKERAEAILRSAGDAILITDYEGYILSVNPAFEQQTGYTAKEVIGQHTRLLASPTMPRRLVRELVEVLQSGHRWRGEVVLRRKDGTEYDADLNAAPLREAGSARRYVTVVRDISARKEVERMKDALVSNVSHELRTPIASLKLFLSLLERAVPPELRDAYLPTLKRETERLHRIVEDVLRLSRLDQGRVELSLAPVDLNVLVGQYVADRSPLAESKGLTLTLDQGPPDLPRVEADEGLLGQVLDILLTNALNYTPPGGRVTVGAALRQAGAEGKRWAGFSVGDTGPGIPPHEQGQLFERFFRGKVGSESGVPGTGLGLAIAEEIVGRHGGHIEVESEGQPGKGSTFSVWLPLR